MEAKFKLQEVVKYIGPFFSQKVRDGLWRVRYITHINEPESKIIYAIENTADCLDRRSGYEDELEHAHAKTSV